MEWKKMTSLLAACAVSASLFGFELGTKDTVIYSNGKNNAAARELSAYLHKVFGKKFPVKDAPKTIPADLQGIFVGVKPETFQQKWDAKRDCSVRIVEKDRVWLFGNDENKLKGSANAVYDFLERYAGVRWLWPGETGTVADPSKPVSIAPESSVYVPPFERRMTNSFNYGMASLSKDDTAMLSAWLRHRGVDSSLRARGSGFQHAFASLLPREKYGKEHPEYYALVTPARWIGEPKPTVPTRLNEPLQPGPWQLCTSNPEVRKIIADKLVNAKTDAIQSISPNDGYGFCECPACRKQDPKGQGIDDNTYKLTDRMYNFLEDIANQVYKRSPETKIGLFSYSFYAEVPEKKISLPGNVYLSCCYTVSSMNKEQEEQLNRKLIGLSKTGARIIGREYWGCHYMMNYPLSHSRKIDRNLKLLHQIGAAGIYGETGKDFSSRASDLYILVKLSWDPTLKREDLLKDFCEKGFGPKAAPVMYDLFEKIEDIVEEAVENHSKNRGKIFAHYNNSYAERNHLMAQIFNKDFFKMCDAELKKAAKLADTPARKARVAFIANGIEYAKRTTESLEALADLASAGTNLPLTQPSGKEIVMEKGVLNKVINRAIEAEQNRRRFMLTRSAGVAFGRGVVFGSDAMSLRPWRSIAEMARLKLKADRYNYLVNAAFEYSGFSWEVSGKGQFSYTTARNHDNDHNVMVQCHHKQGISLQLEVAPGESMTIRNLRKISPAASMKATFKMFVRSEKDPLPLLKVTLGKAELQGVDVTKEIPDTEFWHELRFRPTTIPAGAQEFKMVVTNPGKTPIVLNFDDLDLRLAGFSAVTK